MSKELSILNILCLKFYVVWFRVNLDSIVVILDFLAITRCQRYIGNIIYWVVVLWKKVVAWMLGSFGMHHVSSRKHGHVLGAHEFVSDTTRLQHAPDTCPWTFLFSFLFFLNSDTPCTRPAWPWTRKGDAWGKFLKKINKTPIFKLQDKS